MTHFAKPKCPVCRKVSRDGHICKPRKALPRMAIQGARSPIGRAARPKRVNPKRRERTFAYGFHSIDRVRWVKAQVCPISGETPCENAHVLGPGGMGLRGHYTGVIPLAPRLHRRLHTVGPETFLRERGLHPDTFKVWALETERAWLAYLDAEIARG